MQDIHFYTPEFELIHTESKVTSVQWDLFYTDVGKLELHTDSKNDLVGQVLPSTHGDVIAVQGKFAAWIHGGTDIRDKYDFGIYGKTLAFMLKWRGVDPFTTTDTVENIIRQKITEQFMTSGSSKYMSNFALADAIGGTSTTTYEFKDNQKSLFDVVQDLCKIDNLGFTIDFDTDNEKYVFRLYRGVDRSADQDIIPNVIFSTDDKNFSDSSYTFKQDDYYSCGYVPVKDDETGATTYTEVIKDTAEGFYRREKILSSSTTESEGTNELAKAKKKEVISGKLTPRIKYDVDYNLGDIVTVQKKVGNHLIAQNKRIIELLVVYEPRNSYERPILDEEDGI